MIKSLALTLATLFLVGIVIFISFDIDKSTIDNLNMEESLLPFRLSLYFIIVLAWPKVAQFIVYIRANRRSKKKDDAEQVEKLKQGEARYFNTLRWKVLIFFIIFEVVAVNKLWL